MNRLSIITASHKNVEGLKRLKKDIDILLRFEVLWIIKDSGKCKDTANWGASVETEGIKFISELDDGIYSALNRALLECASEFYMVVGTDDYIYSDSLIKILKMIELGFFSECEVASFPVIINCRIHKRKVMCPLFISASGLISSHSVGTLIRTDLHKKVGMYDAKYKILADSLLLRRAYEMSVKFKFFDGPVVGSFSENGISSTNHALRIQEAYLYNIACGDYKILQGAIKIIRSIKYYLTK